MLYFAVGKRALLTVYSVNGHFNALLRKICFSSHVAFEALIHKSLVISCPADKRNSIVFLRRRRAAERRLICVI